MDETETFKMYHLSGPYNLKILFALVLLNMFISVYERSSNAQYINMILMSRIFSMNH